MGSTVVTDPGGAWVQYILQDDIDSWFIPIDDEEGWEASKKNKQAYEIELYNKKQQYRIGKFTICPWQTPLKD